jgi:hypothetical protein
MPFKIRTESPWWSIGTAITLAIAVALVLFSTVPQMVSNDLTAQMTPEVSEPAMVTQPRSPAVSFRGAPKPQVGVVESNRDDGQRFGAQFIR